MQRKYFASEQGPVFITKSSVDIYPQSLSPGKQSDFEIFCARKLSPGQISSACCPKAQAVLLPLGAYYRPRVLPPLTLSDGAAKVIVVG